MRRRSCLLVGVLVLAGCGRPGDTGAGSRVADDSVVSPTRPNAPLYDVDQLVHIRWHAAVGFSPDARWVAFTSDVTGRRQVWKVPTAGGWPTELTFGNEPVAAAAWARDALSLAFERDSGGSERYDLYTVSSGGGLARNLTASPEASERLVGYSDDGRFLAFVSDSGRPGHFELWLRDLGSGRQRRITADTVSILGGVWSHDSRYMALARTNDFADVDAVLLDVSNGTTWVLTRHTGTRAYTPVAFSPDDRDLLVISDAKDGLPRLAVIRLGPDSLRWVETGPWPIEAAGWSRGGMLAYSEDADGRVTTYLMREGGGGRRRVGPEGGSTSFVEFSDDGRLVLLTHSDATRAADVWVHDVRRDTTWQVTYAMVGGVDPADLPVAALVHLRSFDGRRISAFVTVPFNLRRDGTNPAIVLAHGGPSGQWQDVFSRDAAYYANHGYVVIRPNVRGSTGYGRAFEDLNNLDWGGGDLKDLVAAADYLVATGFVARSRIAVMGGSYGGYLTLAALAFTPQRWAAGVDLYGISSIVTLARTTDPMLMPYLTREMGSLPGGEALMRERSPLFGATRIRAPLLVLQGDNDPRVPLEESRQIAEAIRRQHGIVEFVVYPGEGHGFHLLEDQLDSMQRAVRFLDRYVKGRG
jgi:dipeptidyl aminopeptidase/acylaminoacyl peptidase